MPPRQPQREDQRDASSLIRLSRISTYFRHPLAENPLREMRPAIADDLIASSTIRSSVRRRLESFGQSTPDPFASSTSSHSPLRETGARPAYRSPPHSQFYA